MDNLENDMAKSVDLDMVNKYYQENLKRIMKINTNSNFHPHDGGSSTASDSDSDVEEQQQNHESVFENSALEEQLHNSRKCSFSVLSNIESDDVERDNQSDFIKNNAQHINSIAINNSSEIHFGNKTTYYNCPVTIKQILIKDDNHSNGKRILSAVNKGYEGSQNDLNESNDTNNVDTNEVEKDASKNLIFQSLIRSKTKTILTSVTIVSTIILIVISVTFIFLQIENEDLRIIKREEWLAKPEKEALTKLDLPVNRIIIAHTVTRECLTEESCIKVVQEIQDMHMGHNFSFSDIGYNFLIGGDGNIFEGRGWEKQGAHTSGYNRDSFGIAYIGNFMHKLPNEHQLTAGFLLFRAGVKLNKLAENFKIYGARQLRSTESPGTLFYTAEIIKWDHWSEE